VSYNPPVRPNVIRLLAVVIALLLPLQGMAVVVAGQCMAFGHHEATVSHDDHGQTAHGQDGHDHASHSHAEDATGTAQGDEGDGNSAHCGPCTACCASASITGPAGVSIQSSASSMSYVFSQFPPIGVQPDGLDRPPLAL
jgi:hypothetical protein